MTAIAQAPVPEGDAPVPGQTPPAPRPRPRPRPKLPRLPKRSDKGFHRALGIALAIHLLLMLGLFAAPESMIPESLTKARLGEPGADPDGVSVEIVDIADLQSRSNAPLRGSMPDQPTQNQPQSQPQQPPEPQAQPQEEQQEPQQQPQAAEPQRQPAPKEKARERSEVVEAPGTPPPPPSEAPAEQPKPPPPQKQASRPPTPSPPQQPRVLDLRVPQSALNITPRDFGASRPPGTTRSGENDQFFQGVIRALWRTFPELRTTGIVGIRFLLNTKGNMVSINVTRTSGDPSLDQNVVFSVRQASFPIPPDNSTEVDRTFLITYIYR